MNVLEHLVTLIRHKPTPPAKPLRRRVSNPGALGAKARQILRRKLKQAGHWSKDEVDWMKVPDLLAAAELAGIDVAAIKAGVNGEPEPPMDFPPEWLTEQREHGGINTVGDLLGEICGNELVDFPDATVARDVQLATIVRLIEGRLTDAFDLMTELTELLDDPELGERLGKLILKAIDLMPTRTVDATTPMVPWSQ